MKNLLNLDSPLMIFFSNLTDVLILNVLCLVCCLPIVTIGPSITAMHYVTLKMARDEEGYVLKSFFKSFRENFKQSMIAWLGFLAVTVIFFVDYKLLKGMNTDNSKQFLMVIFAIYLFICLVTMYIFPLMARFENTLKQTIKNAVFMSILHFFKTMVMAIIYAIPFVLIPLHYNWIMVFFLVGLAGPAYFNSYIWKSIFRKYEPEEEKEEITNDMDFQIPEEELEDITKEIM